MVGTAVGLVVLLDSSSKQINLVELLTVVAELGHSIRCKDFTNTRHTVVLHVDFILQLALLQFYYSHCDLQLTSCKCIIYSTFTTTVSRLKIYDSSCVECQ